MRYILKIVVPSVPPYNHEAFGFAEDLVQSSKGMPPAPRLRQFYDLITARYPCGTSGVYGQGKMGTCPWAEQPLIEGFTGEVAVITLVGRNVELIPFILRRAGSLALTVLDEQAGKVHRPATFRVVFSGVSPKVIARDLGKKLVPLLKRSEEDVFFIISRPGSVLKRRLDHVTAKRFVETMGLIGCECHIEKEYGEGAVLVGASHQTQRKITPANEAQMTPERKAEDAPSGDGEQPGSWMSRTWDRISGSRE